MSRVSLEGVVKRYDDVPVIHGLDLAIEEGEFCVFVGPSGCGKSTLLRMVAGLEETTAGRVRIGARDVTHEDPARRGVAMVFQTYALYPHMTVEQNMSFGLRMNGHPAADIRARVAEASRILKLEEYLGRKPKALSGGQRQRVAIGRAIVRGPEVFLFDEPLSNLDAELRVEMRVEIARLHQEIGATMIYVTHDQVEAMTLADRIVVLRGGRIEQVGAPMDLYRDPREPVRGGLHRLARDELPRGHRRRRRGGGSRARSEREPGCGPSAAGDRRQPRVAARAPRHRPRRLHAPGGADRSAGRRVLRLPGLRERRTRDRRGARRRSGIDRAIRWD